jgi:hypothetical protein
MQSSTNTSTTTTESNTTTTSTTPSLGTPLLDFLLHGMDKTTFLQLLSDRWSCTCIIRVLTPLSRAMILSAIGDGGVYEFDFTQKDGLMERKLAIELLLQLGLFQQDPVATTTITVTSPPTSSAFADAAPRTAGATKNLNTINESSYKLLYLHPIFYQNVRLMLISNWNEEKPYIEMSSSSSADGGGGVGGSSSNNGNDMESSERHAREKFTQRLKYVIEPNITTPQTKSSTTVTTTAVQSIERIFETDMKLIDGKNPRDRKITRFGLSFMLLSVHDQVWSIIQTFAKTNNTLSTTTTTDNDNPAAQILRTLFRLSFCTFGTRYVFPSKTDDVDFFHVFPILHELGLIFADVIHYQYFIPTSLGVYGVFKPILQLSQQRQQHRQSNIVGLVAEGSRFSEMKIIVETTMSVFAFVEPNADTEIQCKLLELFVEIQAMLPNVIVGLLTRESVQRAISKGIKATQLIDFLTQNAHEKVIVERSKGGHLVPQNVKDQLILWGSETSRLTFIPGHVVDGFKDRKLFNLVLDFAKQHNHCAWYRDDEQNLDLCGIFVKEEHWSEFIEYFKEIRRQLMLVNG